MRDSRSRQFVTSLLVLGAAVFGMVLAGGLEITPTAATGPAIPAVSSGPVPGYSAGLPDFANLASAVDPAVVTIRATSIERRSAAGSAPNPFEFFFGPRQRRPDQQDAPQQQPQQDDQPFRQDSGGSGFVVSEDGLVVTNYHVIREAENLTVVLEDREYKATIKGTDAATDIAVLKIDLPRKLTYLRLGDSDALRVGEWVMAVGSPLDLSHSVTVGVVSAKGRSIGINDTSFENFIQTDAAINFGNSGGPLLNLAGEVIGINTAINFAAENIGFAVPSNTLKQILPQLVESGKVRRGYMGVNIRNLDFDAAEAYGLESTSGALVMNVLPGQPADKAGLRPEDIILEVNDRPIKNTRELIDYVSSLGPDASIRLDVLREGKRRDFVLKLAERDVRVGQAAEAPEPEKDSAIDWLGLRYQDLTPTLRSTHNLPENLEGALVTTVSPTSPLYEDGLRSGEVLSVITSVNGKNVGSVREFETAVKAVEKGGRMRLYVRRFSPQGEELPPLLSFPQAQ